MQRYRVNYVLLIGLVVGGLVFGGAVYGLWRLQIDRNADSLTARAEEALQEGNLRGALSLYRQYLAIRPNDEEALVDHALTWRKLTEQDDVRMEEVGEAYQEMERTIRKLPHNDELRKEMVDMCMKLRRETDALEHIRIMLDRNPASEELQVLRARCLIRSGDYSRAEEYSYALIGYDPESDTFDVEQAKTPDAVIVYRNLADMLRTQLDRPEFADRVMDQLIKANPESYEAHLQRGQYYLLQDRQDAAEADIRRAYQLNPEDADVLITISDLAKKQESMDEAEKYLLAGVEKYPQDARFYQQLADVEMRRSNYEQALEFVNKGIGEVSPRDSLMLLAYKADLQIRAMDVAGVSETIATMRSRGFRPDYLQWLNARVMLIEEKWYEAAQALEEARPLMADFPDIQIQIDVHLGLCYEKLGQLELALDSYEFALRADPEQAPAAMGRQRVLARLRPGSETLEATGWQQALQEELKKPEAEQNWDRVAAMMEDVADQMKLTDAQRMLLKAELLMMRKEYAEARDLLQRAFHMSPEDETILRAAVRLLRQDPSQGPVKALTFLEERVFPKMGDIPQYRSEKADLLIAINDTDLVNQLAELTRNMDEWNTDQKVYMWYTMAAKYFQMGMRDEAQRCWLAVTELAPNDLPTRVMLFTLAHDANDDAAMQAAQEKILEVVRTKEDSTWRYTEARRLLSLYRRGQLGEDVLATIDELVEAAGKDRPEWHELHLLQAELALISGQEEVALEHYQAAARLGRPHPAAIVKHVELLVNRGRFQEAKLVVERIPLATRQQLLGQLYAEILFNNAEVKEAMDSAQIVIDNDSENAVKQLWYGQLMARAAQTNVLSDKEKKEADAKAGAAIQRAVELGPGIQQAWLALVGYHVFHKDQEKAEEALRQAQLALSSEQLPVVMAKCYELMGRTFDAENMYRAIYDAEPENVVNARQLAAFYLGDNNRLTTQDKIAKATPLLNVILKAGAEGKLEKNDQHLLWARRMSARLLAESGDYQKLLDAEKLLASNSINGDLPIEDRLQMAQILAPRPEPVSRQKAMALLEEVKEINRLNLSAELILGQLYFAMGEWPKCQRQMLELVGRFPDAAIVRDAYIRMLLERGMVNRTRRHLEKLIELAPNSLSTLELIARVSARMGQEQQARAALGRALPAGGDLTKLTDEQLPIAEKIADLLAEELNDEERALKIYQYLVTRDPKKILKLAEFVGRRREVDQAFQYLNQVYNPQVAAAVLEVALRVVRERRDDVGSQFDEQIQEWIDRGLRENPYLIALQMQQAEFYDIQERYADAAKTYRELLKRDDLQGTRRAIVLNNLSYLLALGEDPSGKDEAMRLVREAVTILGPQPDILDTRAVVFISQKQFEDAIADLELSVTQNPTASKYFHKALAHLGAKQNTDALFAWNEAVRLGLSRDTISPMERDEFEQVQDQIEQLQADAGGFDGDQPLGEASRPRDFVSAGR